MANKIEWVSVVGVNTPSVGQQWVAGAQRPVLGRARALTHFPAAIIMVAWLRCRMWWSCWRHTIPEMLNILTQFKVDMNVIVIDIIFKYPFT